MTSCRRAALVAAFAAIVGLTFAGCSSGAVPPPAGARASSGAVPPSPDARVRSTQSWWNPGLSRYNIDMGHIAVAGVSSGAMMAGQLHYAHSANVKYEAIFAGAPYYCAINNLTNATNCMLGVFAQPLSFLESATRQFASWGWIDQVNDLSGSKGYYFSGSNDHVVATRSVRETAQMLRDFGGTTVENYATNAGHTWPTPDGPNPCSHTGPNWMNNCGIDPEQTFLTEFFGTLHPRNAGRLNGQLINFDQDRYSAIPPAALAVNMDNNGWVFVPQDCASGAACKLLVALHGCLDGQSYVGNAFYTEANLNEWADTNHIVVLYPQLWAGWGGCWDWYGYGGANYFTQGGLQVKTIWNMVQAL